MLKNKLKNYLKTFLTIAFLLGIFAAGGTKPSLGAATGATADIFALTWSSNSYIPPDYEGLAMPTRGSQISVFVLPTKKLSSDPEKLNYRWLLDDEIASWASGQGKSVFSFRATKWSDDYHAVQVQVLNGESVIWRKTISIKVSNAEAIFKLAGSPYSTKEMISTKTGQTIKIFSLPFFFNVKSLSDLNFQWQIDGQDLTNLDNKEPDIFSLSVPSAKLANSLIKNLNLIISDKKDDSKQASSRVILEIK